MVSTGEKSMWVTVLGLLECDRERSGRFDVAHEPTRKPMTGVAGRQRQLSNEPWVQNPVL